MTRKILTAAALLAILMSGCAQNDQPAVSGDDAPVPQPNPVVADAGMDSQAPPVEGVTFLVSPQRFRKCDADKGYIVANVKWDVTAAGVKYVNVLVNGGAGVEPTLFMTGKASGERKTGNWVKDGTRFILQDAANKKQLATVSVSGQDC